MTELSPSRPPSPSSPTSNGRKRRAAAIAGVVGAVAAIGAGGWAWQGWMAQGPQAAQALPGDTLAYVGIDLDPPGGQKIEAYQALKRFPRLAEHLGITDQDDLRRSLLDQVTAERGCHIGYDDLAAWVGDRAGLAVVPSAGPEPEVVAVVQVSDPDAARAGLDDLLASCGDEVGYTLGDGWAVLARTDEVARKVVADGRRTQLGEDADFQELTSAAGDAGVVTLYAAPEAGQALLDAVEDHPYLSMLISSPSGLSVDPVDTLLSLSTIHSYGAGAEDDFMAEMSPEERRLWKRMDRFDELSPAEQDQLMKEMDELYADQSGTGGVMSEDGLPEIDEDEMMGDFSVPIPDDVRRRLEDFTGLGGVARFDDGALELEVVADPIVSGDPERYDGNDALAGISALPDTAALAFGGGFSDGWAERAITHGPLSFGAEPKQLLADFEKSTGLTAKELEDLGGDGLAVIAGPGFEDAFDFEGTSDDFPVAVRITGDAAKVEAALSKVRTALGGKDPLPSARSGDAVVIGADRAFVEEVAKAKGALSGSDRFAKVVPDAGDALTITYIDFDRGDWVEQLAAGQLSRADLAPLDAAGITVSAAGERQRTVVRLTFDD
ncbi:hypothetical protein [Nocardioides sp. SLBN-35]|uniref:hypothetical protein n=1 Tax=Nocardioides sp. SLBN-35 TaxID=2768445 RepID=UPI00114EA7C7|nr:hypothetical protein [Nocardioides sp. SLBN-35]